MLILSSISPFRKRKKMLRNQALKRNYVKNKAPIAQKSNGGFDRRCKWSYDRKLISTPAATAEPMTPEILDDMQ